MATGGRYDNESISALKGADRVRLRPGVIFGSDGLEGCEHSFFEILSNSIDEAREGHGDRIEVRRFTDGSLQVEDYGRGIPLDYNENEKRYNWELVYCELYAGGKYNNNEGENYEFSLGLNGLGACATQYSSSRFDVKVWRDGFEYSLHFEKGENIGGLSKKPYSGKRTGTLQRWLPDREVFTETQISDEYFERVLKQQAVVNKGVNFSFKDDINGVEKSFFYPEGILGYVEEINGEGALSEPVYIESEGSGRDRADKEEYKLKCGICFAFNRTVSRIEYFHNSSFLEHGGSPDKAVRLAFANIFDKLARERNKYKAQESKLSFSDIEDSLIIVISSFSTRTSYENQTKKAINNKFIQDFINEFLKERLTIWATENLQVSDSVIDQLLINKRSRESAERQRLNMKKNLMGRMDVSNRVKKFVDCRTRDVSKRELYIVEGDSALGSTKMGRDSEFQAIMPVRGKILNCLKTDITNIFKSEIITDLLKVLGCGVEVKSKSNKELTNFDLSRLRWDKIIICTDADVDGFQIRTLILAMFYRLTPTLIREGKVFIAESPLFEINLREGKEDISYFAYDEKEKSEILRKIGNKKFSIQRSKGLGENEPEMMWETTMNPETRRLIKVEAVTESEMEKTFDLLLGNDLQGRKEFIKNEGHLYLDRLDLA